MKKLIISLLTKKSATVDAVATLGPGCPYHDAPLKGGIQKAGF